MSIAQHQEYTRELGLKVPIRPSTIKELRGIGVQGKIEGEAHIEIPCESLGLVIDMVF